MEPLPSMLETGYAGRTLVGPVIMGCGLLQALNKPTLIRPMQYTICRCFMFPSRVQIKCRQGVQLSVPSPSFTRQYDQVERCRR
jgi:hypothetical protein